VGVDPSSADPAKTIRPMTPSLRSLILVAGLLLGGLSVTAAEPKPSAPLNQDGSVKIPAELLLDEIKQTPYAERAALRAKLAEAETRFADRMPEWEARKNSLPEKERNAAENDFKQLVRQREILRQKIDGVENAAAETWNSAKSDLYSVLQSAIRTYKKLLARFPA
jgi:hypothetical protein